MKKIFSVVFVILILFMIPFSAFAAESKLNSLPLLGEKAVLSFDDSDYSNVLLVDVQTGTVLYDKNAETQFVGMGCAITLMTAYISASELGMDEIITVRDVSEFAPIGGRQFGLQPGDKYSVADLIALTIVYGAQDAAAVLALSVSSTVEEFVDEMNYKAEQLGMYNTSYDDPYGGGNELNLTTAGDIAKLVFAVYEMKDIKKIFTVSEYTMVSSSSPVNVISNRIDMMKATSDNYDARVRGIGIGFTDETGFNAVIGAKSSGREMLLVMYSPDDTVEYQESVRQYIDYAYSEYKSVDFKNKATDLAEDLEVEVNGYFFNGFDIDPLYENENENELYLLFIGENTYIGNMQKNERDFKMTYEITESDENFKRGNAVGIGKLWYKDTLIGEVKLIARTITMSNGDKHNEPGESSSPITLNPDGSAQMRENPYGWVVCVVFAAVVGVAMILIAKLILLRRF